MRLYLNTSRNKAPVEMMKCISNTTRECISNTILKCVSNTFWKCISNTTQECITDICLCKLA